MVIVKFQITCFCRIPTCLVLCGRGNITCSIIFYSYLEHKRIKISNFPSWTYIYIIIIFNLIIKQRKWALVVPGYSSCQWLTSTTLAIFQNSSIFLSKATRISCISKLFRTGFKIFGVPAAGKEGPPVLVSGTLWKYLIQSPFLQFSWNCIYGELTSFCLFVF